MQDSFLTTKPGSALQIYPRKASLCTALLNCQNTTEPQITAQGSNVDFKGFTLHCSYHLVESCARTTPPFLISSLLKIFLSSVLVLCYFPEDCCWIDWALIAWPQRVQGGISPSLLPTPHPPTPVLLCRAAAAPCDFSETASSDSPSLSVYCLHVDTHGVGQLICIYSHCPLSAF